MDDFKLVEEFLSKKNLDGVDKFLLDKYMGAIRNVLNDSIPKQVIRDKIEELEKHLKGVDYHDIEDSEERKFYKKEYMQILMQIQVLKELLVEE